MPATWGFRGLVLTLTVVGVVTNEEIAQAFDEAVANAPGVEPAAALAWLER